MKTVSKQRQSIGLLEFIKNLDLFYEPMPAFNIKGKESVKTWIGAMCSVIIMTLTVAFGLLKLQHLVEKKNPALVTNTEDLGEYASFKLDDDGFMMAFSLETITNQVLDYDTRHVRWIARTWMLDGNDLKSPLYPM